MIAKFRNQDEIEWYHLFMKVVQIIGLHKLHSLYKLFR